MIPNQKVSIKWNKKNKNKFVETGYMFTNYGEPFDIDISHLTEGSEYKIIVVCDFCKKEIKKKYKDRTKSINRSSVKMDSCRECSGKKVTKSHELNGVKKEIEWTEDENGCHTCISHYISIYGYAKIHDDGKKIGVHRLMYEQKYGKIDDDFVIRHKCDNPSCINPEHLVHGTQKDNVTDMFKRGRNPNRIGGRNGRALLTEENVREIKKLILFHSNTYIAKMFNVSGKCISNIRCGTTWKHIK